MECTNLTTVLLGRIIRGDKMMWDDRNPDSMVVPGHPNRVGMIGQVKRGMFSKLSIDSLLVQLRASYSKNDWTGESGISEEQLQAYQQFTKYMSIEEKRNPQRLSKIRIEELSQSSRINSFQIRTLFEIFYMRYRKSGFRDKSLERIFLKSLQRYPLGVQIIRK